MSNLGELAQIRGICSAIFLIVGGVDHRLDLIFPPFHFLLWFCRCWCESFDYDGRETVAENLEVGCLIGGDHRHLRRWIEDALREYRKEQ